MLAARVRSMVAKAVFMQNFESGFFKRFKESEKVPFWRVKSPCAGPFGVQNLLAVAERKAMAPLGGEFCVQSVPPFVLFLFNTPFVITFFQKTLSERVSQQSFFQKVPKIKIGHHFYLKNF